MFSEVRSPTGHFSLLPLPAIFFDIPPPFGAGAMLVLNKFANNSSKLLPQHMIGISTAASQGKGIVGACEVYGITDRAGSEDLNKALSVKRANAALTALKTALSLESFNTVFANGLGERFADEYFKNADNSREAGFRGVVCYLWQSFATATDASLKINVAFASPPDGGGDRRRAFLAPLHMGRLRTTPRSPFA
jgi:hypothetical protein